MAHGHAPTGKCPTPYLTWAPLLAACVNRGLAEGQASRGGGLSEAVGHAGAASASRALGGSCSTTSTSYGHAWPCATLRYAVPQHHTSTATARHCAQYQYYHPVCYENGQYRAFNFTHGHHTGPCGLIGATCQLGRAIWGPSLERRKALWGGKNSAKIV
jgi:hypothetical protein